MEQFYNPAAFANPPAVKTIGQTDYSPLGGYRTPVTGPPYRKLDFSTFKSFPFADRYRIEFREEAFNLTNRVTMGNPNLSPTSAAFGTIASQANTPRRIESGLRLVW